MATSSAWISNGCFACGVATNFPVTIIAAPTFNFSTSAKFSKPSAYTICNGSKKVPSFTTINPKFLELRMLRTQPPIVTVLSRYSSWFRYNSRIFTNSISNPSVLFLTFLSLYQWYPLLLHFQKYCLYYLYLHFHQTVSVL